MNNNNNPQNANNLNIQHFPDIFIHSTSTRSLYETLKGICLTWRFHVVSLSVIFLLSAFLCYYFNHFDPDTLTLVKIENDESNFWLISWGFIIIIVLFQWNIYLFIYQRIFKYKYEKGNGNLFLSFPEEIFQNPVFFITIINHFDQKFLKNAIDNSFWVLISFTYYFLFFQLIHFFKSFDQEILTITNFDASSTKKLKNKIKGVSLFFMAINIFSTLTFALILLGVNESYKYILLSRGGYFILKITELYTSRINEYNFIQSEMNIKEKNLIKNLKHKTLLESCSAIYIFFQFEILFFGDSQSVYFILLIFLFVINQIYYGVTNVLKYRKMQNYYNFIDKSLKTKNAIEEECIICTEKLEKAKILNCEHYFHLICLSKWFEKGNKSCPICRKEIVFNNNTQSIFNSINNQERRIYSFGIRLFRWIPSFSFRVQRVTNVPPFVNQVN